MTNIIVGDITEGSRYWGVANNMKAELASIHRRTGQMNAWRRVSPSVNIHIIIVQGQPKAFIYVDSGVYNFFTPLQWFNQSQGVAIGVEFVDDKPASRQTILKPGFKSLPVNTWYSQEYWVAGGVASRYANVRDLLNIIPNRTADYPPQVLKEVGSPQFTGDVNVNAAAVSGKYCFGMSTQGVAYVWDMSTGKRIHSEQIKLSVPCDFESDLQAKGFWSFNRNGNKACSSVWVSQYNRFNPTEPDSTPPLGWMTSYVVEVEFVIDQGLFAGLAVSVTETPGFCIAADYDWTTQDNVLITAELYSFDYRVHSYTEWQPSTHYPIGTMLKVPIATNNRPMEFYKVVNDATIGDTGVSGVVKPNLNNPTPEYPDDLLLDGDLVIQHQSSLTAMDVWLKIKRLDGTVLRQIELLHNKDPYTEHSGYGTDYDVRGDTLSFENRLTGLDLRVRGVTLSSFTQKAAAAAELYGTAVTLGAAIPIADTEPDHAANLYAYAVLLSTVKTRSTQQTIAAIPYQQEGVANFSIIDAALYAPPYLMDTEPAIDRFYRSKDSVIESFHERVFSKYRKETPLNNRYFIAGGWAKKKDNV